VNNNNRLELTWVGKEKRAQVEPRILLDDPSLSYHAAARKSAADQFDNLLIQGDNLLALKALETEYSGKVKCVFIDPPYNTGSAFTHYDDGLEHSLWLSLMRDRLEILRRLLREDGSIWITIDDNECHYLKVLCDEVFGRANFVANVVWEKKYAPQNDAKWLSDSHDHVLVFTKNKQIWRANLLQRSDAANSHYRNPDNDPRDRWMSDNLSVKTYSRATDYPITTPSGRVVNPPSSRSWSVNQVELERLIADKRIWFGEKGDGVPRLKRFLSEVQDGIVCKTIWQRVDVGDNQDAKRETKALLGLDVFDTPKPEKLIARIVELASNPGDLILDSFAGSGTTGAVAHKMGRRWIMVELGEHAVTHIVPRLKKVIDGSDPGGVTAATGWRGGGGFRFQRLAPSLLSKNQHDRWVISSAYNAEMLAEAMCKHLGFDYQPTPEHWWMMGRSTERDYLCVTTDSLQQEDFEHLSQEVGNERSLLICCKAFMANLSGYRNLTVKKIPQAILDRCEWGKDDYSLQIAALPEVADDEVTDFEDAEAKPKAKPRKSKKAASADLFALANEPTGKLFSQAEDAE
jgi:adenine-specific DNA-methyltransferase